MGLRSSKRAAGAADTRGRGTPAACTQPNAAELAANAAPRVQAAPAPSGPPGQFDPAPPNKFIADYIARHADDFRSYAEALGLPRTVAVGVALGVSEEARHVVQGGFTYPDLHEYRRDAFLDWKGSNKSNPYYAQKYSDSQADIFNGNLNKQKSAIDIGFYWRKLTNPMSNDTGIGNINFGSAAAHLISYFNNVNYKDTDPLNLRKYLLSQNPIGSITANDINFQNLYRDLNDLESPTTAAIAMLNGAKRCNAYGALFGPAFLNLGNGTAADKQRQAALLSTFYKNGSPGFFPDDSGEQRLPSPSQLPTVDQIGHMMGGAYGLRNYSDINGILGGEPGKLGLGSAMNGIINRAMMPGTSDRASAASQAPSGMPATIGGTRLAGSNDPRGMPQGPTLDGVSVNQAGQAALRQPLGPIASNGPTVVATRPGGAGLPSAVSLFAPFATPEYDASSLNPAMYRGIQPWTPPGGGILAGIPLGAADSGDASDSAALSPWDQVVREMWARRMRDNDGS